MKLLIFSISLFILISHGSHGQIVMAYFDIDISNELKSDPCTLIAPLRAEFLDERKKYQGLISEKSLCLEDAIIKKAMPFVAKFFLQYARTNGAIILSEVNNKITKPVNDITIKLTAALARRKGTYDDNHISTKLPEKTRNGVLDFDKIIDLGTVYDPTICSDTFILGFNKIEKIIKFDTYYSPEDVKKYRLVKDALDLNDLRRSFKRISKK